MISSFLKVTEPSENSQPKHRGNDGGKGEIEEGRRLERGRDNRLAEWRVQGGEGRMAGEGSAA